MIDLSFLKKFTKGNKKKMDRYIGIYLSIAPGIFDKMADNIKESDWNQLRINAHSLKPQADYMGVPSLKSALATIESNVAEGNFIGLDKLYQDALLIHNESIPHLNAFINSDGI